MSSVARRNRLAMFNARVNHSVLGAMGLILQIAPLIAAPPKLHVVYVVDSNAGAIGDDIGPGCTAAYKKLDSVMREIFVEEKKDRYVPHLLTGARVSPQNIRTAIRSLTLAQQDALIFW